MAAAAAYVVTYVLKVDEWITWTVGGAAALIAVLWRPAVDVLKAKASDRAVWRRLAPGAPNGRLQRPSQLTPSDVGIQPAFMTVSYIRRDIHSQAVSEMTSHSKLLIAGPSMAGKSTLAFEVVKANFPSHGIWRPPDLSSLVELIDSGTKLRKTVVWLDDLDRFVGARLRDCLEYFSIGNIVVATIRHQELERLLPSDATKPVGWEGVSWFGTPQVLDKWSTDELSRVTDLPPEDIDQARRFGLSYYLGGGPALERKLSVCLSERADELLVLEILCDWARRLQMRRPMPLAALNATLGVEGAQSVESVSDARLKWLTTRVNHTSSMVEEQRAVDGTIAYRVHPYVAERFDFSKPVPLVATWDSAFAIADENELVDLGDAALVELSDDVRAESAWTRSTTPEASVHLAIMMLRRESDGDFERAEALLRPLVNDHATAAHALAVLLEKAAGGPDMYVQEAEILYRRAADDGDPGAAFNAAQCALRSGSEDGPNFAERYLKLAHKLGYPGAARQLANILGQQRRLEEAVALLEDGLKRGFEDCRVPLARCRTMQGDLNAGERLLREAVLAQDDGAALALAQVLLQREDEAAAHEALVLVLSVLGIESTAHLLPVGHEEWRVPAEHVLVKSLLLVGDSETARRFVEQRPADAEIMGLMGEHLYDELDYSEGLSLLIASYNLGRFESAGYIARYYLEIRGRPRVGVRWLRAGSVGGSVMCTQALANVLWELDDSADRLEIKSLWEQALDVAEREGYERGVAASCTNLAVLAEEAGDIDLAVSLAERAVSAGGPVAMSNLADFLVEQGGLRNRIRATRLRRQARRILADESNVPKLQFK